MSGDTKDIKQGCPSQAISAQALEVAINFDLLSPVIKIMFAWDVLVRIAIAVGAPEAQRLGQTAKWLLPRREIDVEVGAMQLFFRYC